MRLPSIRLLRIPPSAAPKKFGQIYRSKLRRQTLCRIVPIRHLHHGVSTPMTPDSSLQSQSQPISNSISQFATLSSKPNSCTEDPIGVKITPSAIQQIERVRTSDKKPNELLRLSVESGGCHGFQYKMEFTECLEEDDFVFTTGNRNGMVVIDEGSLGLMDGSTIDFSTELIGSSFKVLDNPHSAGKGCGCGVSWQLK